MPYYLVGSIFFQTFIYTKIFTAKRQNQSDLILFESSKNQFPFSLLLLYKAKDQSRTLIRIYALKKPLDNYYACKKRYFE